MEVKVHFFYKFLDFFHLHKKFYTARTTNKWLLTSKTQVVFGVTSYFTKRKIPFFRYKGETLSKGIIYKIKNFLLINLSLYHYITWCIPIIFFHFSLLPFPNLHSFFVKLFLCKNLLTICLLITIISVAATMLDICIIYRKKITGAIFLTRNYSFNEIISVKISILLSITELK